MNRVQRPVYIVQIIYSTKKNVGFESRYDLSNVIAQNIKFSIKDFFSKCDQIPRKLRVWSYLLKKSLLENFIFWAVSQSSFINSWQGPE